MIYKIYNESSSLKDSDFDITSDIIAFMSEANQISSSIYESIIENAYSEVEEDPEAWLYESYDIFNEGVIDFIKGIVSKIVNAIKKAILFVKEKILGIKAKNAENAVAKAKDPNSNEKITVMKVEFDKLASDIEKAFDDPEKQKPHRGRGIRGERNAQDRLSARPRKSARGDQGAVCRRVFHLLVPRCALQSAPFRFFRRQRCGQVYRKAHSKLRGRCEAPLAEARACGKGLEGGIARIFYSRKIAHLQDHAAFGHFARR